VAVAHVSRTRYARCREVDIAYQVIGDDGAHDLVVLPAMLAPIDSIDAEPSMYRFHQRLASFARLIRFDYRGMGLSSQVRSIDEIGPESWAEDAIAVMDAVGCEQATIFASGAPAIVGLVLAAKYPERVRGLVIVNGTARLIWAPDYPVGAPVSQATTVTTLAMDPDAMDVARSSAAVSPSGERSRRTVLSVVWA
jgi:pimeloyl-ACP methyl ester carboxylesterase